SAPLSRPAVQDVALSPSGYTSPIGAAACLAGRMVYTLVWRHGLHPQGRGALAPRRGRRGGRTHPPTGTRGGRPPREPAPLRVDLAKLQIANTQPQPIRPAL